MKSRAIRALVLSRHFPVVPQAVLLACYLALIAGAITVNTNIPHIGLTNLSSLLVWFVWWPAILIIAIFAGRLWCTVCPMELASSLAAKIGLKRQVPPLMASGWLMTISFTFVLFWVLRTWFVRSNPHKTAIYMLCALGVAILVGFVYRRRAFCSYVCPLGSVMGLYSRTGCMDWRAVDPAVCDACGTKDCVSAARHYEVAGHSCTSDLYPARPNESRDCLLCTQCAKVCPHENLAPSLRKPGFALFEQIRLRPSDMALLLVITAYLNNNGPKSLWYVAVPLLLGLMCPLQSPREYVNAYSVMLLPMAAVGYLNRMLGGLQEVVPHLGYALADPLGIETARALQSGALKIDLSAAQWLGQGIHHSITVLQIASLAVAALIVLRGKVSHRIEPAGKAAMLVGAIAFYATWHMKEVEQLWHCLVQRT
jgi:polyferredoxin